MLYKTQANMQLEAADLFNVYGLLLPPVIKGLSAH